MFVYTDIKDCLIYENKSTILTVSCKHILNSLFPKQEPCRIVSYHNPSWRYISCWGQSHRQTRSHAADTHTTMLLTSTQSCCCYPHRYAADTHTVTDCATTDLHHLARGRGRPVGKQMHGMRMARSSPVRAWTPPTWPGCSGTPPPTPTVSASWTAPPAPILPTLEVGRQSEACFTSFPNKVESLVLLGSS